MAFSLIGILSVLLETLRPALPLLVAVLVVELALLVWLLLGRTRWHTGRVVRAVAVPGTLVFAIGLLALPSFTRASFSHLHGMLDYGILFLASLGLGLVASLLCYLPAQAVVHRRASAA